MRTTPDFPDWADGGARGDLLTRREASFRRPGTPAVGGVPYPLTVAIRRYAGRARHFLVPDSGCRCSFQYSPLLRGVGVSRSG